MHDLDRIDVSSDRLARWLDVAHGLGRAGEVLVIELMDFGRDPVRHRLRRAADVARDLVRSPNHPTRPVVEALATELEVIADRWQA